MRATNLITKIKIGEFKYNDIRDLINNIKNNTISRIDAKKDLNALNKTKNTEIKNASSLNKTNYYIFSTIFLKQF